jgi:hypothetical protein
MLPVHNLITINLAVITTTTSYRLYWEIRLNELPRPKEYLTMLVKTVFWVSVFYIAYVLAGGMGLWGILILSVVIAAWKIYQGWTLFDTSTKWMADKIWNRTTNDYNLLEALTNEQGNSTTNVREDTHGTPGQNENVKEESSSNTSQPQPLPASKEELQEVSQYHTRVSKPRKRSTKKQAVPIVSEDLGTRKQVNLKHDVR